MLNQLKKDLDKLKDRKQAELLCGFFKTGKGEYGEGQIFLGIKGGVPATRKLAKKYLDLDLKDLQELLKSKIHEYRFVALVILEYQYRKSKDTNRKKIVDFYLKNTKNINNWDLVDMSAPKILGNYLLNKDRKILYKLANSKNLWEKRIAVLSTFAFIKENQFNDSLKIAKILLNDKHDLIHKAVGWMLREIGNKNYLVEEKFLKKQYKKMPRTMLRYSIEKFEEKTRIMFLQEKI